MSARPPSRPPRPASADGAFLEAYRPDDFARPSVAVDLVVLTILRGELCVLLVRRREAPFAGELALPGGFVRVGDARRDQGEDLIDAARRELTEETGLDASLVWLEQLAAFGRPHRDPRMRVISVAYYAIVRPELAPGVRPGGDAEEALWMELPRALRSRLAFDHREILAAADERVRRDVDQSAIARHLVGETFSIPELRAVRAILTGEPQDPGNFRRRFARMLDDGVVLPVTSEKRATATKPAALYRFAPRRPRE